MPACQSPTPTRTALVTGATSGIGLHVAIALARESYAVTLLGRDEGKLKTAEAIVRGAGSASPAVDTLKADLSDFDQVQRVATKLRASGRPLNLLVNNAAIMAPPRLLAGTAGYEMQLSVNGLHPLNWSAASESFSGTLNP